MDKANIAILIAVVAVVLAVVFSVGETTPTSSPPQNITFESLAGNDTAYVCVYANGTLYRDNSTCT